MPQWGAEAMECDVGGSPAALRSAVGAPAGNHPSNPKAGSSWPRSTPRRRPPRRGGPASAHDHHPPPIGAPGGPQAQAGPFDRLAEVEPVEPRPAASRRARLPRRRPHLAEAIPVGSSAVGETLGHDHPRRRRSAPAAVAQAVTRAETHGSWGCAASGNCIFREQREPELLAAGRPTGATCRFRPTKTQLAPIVVIQGPS